MNVSCFGEKASGYSWTNITGKSDIFTSHWNSENQNQKHISRSHTHRKFKVCFNKLYYLSGKETSFIATQEILAHIEQWIFKDMHHLSLLWTISCFIK